MDTILYIILDTIFVAFCFAFAGYVRNKYIKQELSLNPITPKNINDEFVLKLSKDYISGHYVAAMICFFVFFISGILTFTMAPQFSLVEKIMALALFFVCMGGLGILCLFEIYRSPIFRVNVEYIERIYPQSRRLKISWAEIEEIRPPVLSNSGDGIVIIAPNKKFGISQVHEGTTRFLVLISINLPESKWHKIRNEVLKARSHFNDTLPRVSIK